ncbi:porin family protein [Flavobacterium sp. 3HN19-14]|uniref:porin family protein n=1 Tax=Flavobacterium sp. 3HN19-14 TaxID=3448133 RepID=UPI003EE26DB8
MKKLLFGLMALIGTFSAHAQGKKNVEFGFNAGYNAAAISTDDGDTDSRSTFNFGFSADYYFSTSWSLKGKLIYDKKGYDNGLTSGVTTDIKLDYLTVPVMASWHFGPDRIFYANIGPYVGFLLNAKETSFENDIKNEVNSTDFGISYGLGVKVPVSDKLRLFFELEEADGLTNVFKDNDGYDNWNRRASINFGVNFLLK